MKPLKVFYLDDEPLLLEIFAEAFSSPTITIQTFSDPQAFFSAVRANPPDVIFLDYRLAGTTGEKIARQLDSKLPKAVVSGDVSLDCGNLFQAQFSKPFSIEEIQKFLNGMQSAV